MQMQHLQNWGWYSMGKRHEAALKVKPVLQKGAQSLEDTAVADAVFMRQKKKFVLPGIPYSAGVWAVPIYTAATWQTCVNL